MKSNPKNNAAMLATRYTVKPLPTFFEFRGLRYSLVNRVGNVALYEVRLPFTERQSYLVTKIRRAWTWKSSYRRRWVSPRDWHTLRYEALTVKKRYSENLFYDRGRAEARFRKMVNKRYGRAAKRCSVAPLGFALTCKRL